MYPYHTPITPELIDEFHPDFSDTVMLPHPDETELYDTIICTIL